MASKKKKKSRSRRHRAARLDNLSPEEVLSKGELLLGQEKFQDAISCFKQLLKNETSERALAGLEQAYLGRIAALAAKSMTKEALALLETLVQRCPGADVDSVKLVLLIQADKYSEAARLYDRCHNRLTPAQKERLEALFGALLTADVGLKESDFAADSPVVRSYPRAMEAVGLFCSGREGELQDSLRKIPFRSPYRDLRILLTGLHQLPADGDKGRELLGKIGEDSPYFHTAAAYLAATDAPQDILANLAALPNSRQQQFRELHGIPFNVLKALEELGRADDSPLGLYRFMSRHVKCFNFRQKRALLEAILPFCGVRISDILELSSDFTMPEKFRLLALAAEKDDVPVFAVQFWDDYLKTIDSDDAARHREIALVLRRKAGLMERQYYEFPPEDIIETMLKSLEYDPGHAQAWLDAAKFAGRHRLSQQQYAILRDAVEKLPDNVPVLLAAMKAGGNRGAHKKAAGLAARVLKIDPINTAALDFLVESRLEHGRKLASQRKLALAEKELQRADTRVKSIRFRGRSQICLGMVLLHQGRNEDGLQHIEAGRQENGFPIIGHLLTALEARLYGLPVKWQNEFDKALRQAAGAAEDIDASEFLRIISWLTGFAGNQWLALKEVCQGLKRYFSRAAALNWGLEEGLQLCRGMERADLTIALAKCTERLRKKYPDVVECRVWHLVAAGLKKNKPLTWNSYSQLEDMLDELETQGKSEFIEHIEDIIQKSGLADHSMYFDDAPEEDFDFFDLGPFEPSRQQNKKGSGPKPKKTPKKKKSQSTPKQLNLFDDDL